MLQTHEYKILLADDDPDDREFLLQAIKNLNQPVSMACVADGREVLGCLSSLDEKEFPDLIVIDYKMPVLNATDVLQKMGEEPRYRNIPVIVWSTSNQPEHIRRCLECGAVNYFTKPSSQAELDILAEKIFDICVSSSGVNREV